MKKRGFASKEMPELGTFLLELLKTEDCYNWQELSIGISQRMHGILSGVHYAKILGSFFYSLHFPAKDPDLIKQSQLQILSIGFVL